jgi:hypothetical protein
VLKGSIELMLSDETVVMGEGDSVHYVSNPERQKITNSSATLSFVLWVGTI